jgi:hypothetical protein
MEAAQRRESQAPAGRDSQDPLARERDAALTLLCAVYVAAALLLTPAGQPIPWSAVGTLAFIPILAVLVARLEARRPGRVSSTLRACWPLAAAPVAYLAEVQILELQRGRYIDGILAHADAWLGIYQGGQPLWSMGGPIEELANMAYASYYLIPVMVGFVALRRGAHEATRLTAALTLASLMCGLVWLIFPSGGYHVGGSPQGPAFGPFTALVHGLYAQHPHYAAAFPSEHVAHAVALAGVLRRDWGPWIWLWALGIALSTVVGQYHYAFDGVAGWAVGMAAATWVCQGGVEVVSAWPFRARAA